MSNLTTTINNLITNNINSSNGILNILTNYNLKSGDNVDVGFDTSVIYPSSGTFTGRLYHIYKYNLITSNNISPLLDIINGNYLYFFRQNYIYYLDIVKKRIYLKRLVFPNVSTYTESIFTVLFNEFEENVYYYNLNVNCSNCTKIFVNESNNAVFLFLPAVGYIIMFNIISLSIEYINLPPGNIYSDFMIADDLVNTGLLSELLLIYNNVIEFYDINNTSYTLSPTQVKIPIVSPENFSISYTNVTKTYVFSSNIQKNILYLNNYYTLLDTNELIFNNVSTNKITNIEDIFINNIFIKNNVINHINPYQSSQIMVQDFKIQFTNNYVRINNLYDWGDNVVITVENNYWSNYNAKIPSWFKT
jgi:hypothetical protein